ncbi:hypothetical protein LRY60_03430 [Candidatus Woesebacteria bacterium]|nr:hypothetical protein [Candidatus Woesebacteria bacterium]MCD8546234.1 hypothetical protein [Candidatus Woesebacteria bacterium]
MNGPERPGAGPTLEEARKYSKNYFEKFSFKRAELLEKLRRFYSPTNSYGWHIYESQQDLKVRNDSFDAVSLHNDIEIAIYLCLETDNIPSCFYIGNTNELHAPWDISLSDFKDFLTPAQRKKNLDDFSRK